MAKRFSPLIGLAVVVALAMVAVFGAMSLTNPAFAEVNSPADSQLAERTFSPQMAPEMDEDGNYVVYEGEMVELDITSKITGGVGNYDTTKTPDIEIRSNVPNLLVQANVMIDTGIGANGMGQVVLEIDGAGATPGTGRLIIRLPLKGDSTQHLEVPIAVVDATGVMAEGSVPDQKVQVGKTDYELDMEPHFMTGRGAPNDIMIASYTTTTPPLATTVGSRNILVTPPSGAESVFIIDATGGTEGTPTQAGDSFFIVITVTDSSSPAATATQRVYFDVVEDVGTAGFATLAADSYNPGANTRYKVAFEANSVITTGVDEITIELDSFDVPSSIDAGAVTVSVSGDYTDDGISCDTTAGTATCSARTVTNSAADVAVNGEKIIITLKVASDDFVNTILKGDAITIVIRQSAGVSNPAAGGGYGRPLNDKPDEDMLVTIGDEEDPLYIQEIEIPRTVGLDPDDGGRGDMVTATAKGFRKSTTVHFFLDEDGNGMRDTAEFDLCTATVGGNSIGSCDFEVTRPPFDRGENAVNAVDGYNKYATMGESDTFTLDPSLSATPMGGTPGEIILIQLADFEGSNVSLVRLARRDLCNDANDDPDDDVEGCSETIPSTGDLNFRVTIPDWAPDGKQDFRVDVGTGDDAEDASITLDITGPLVNPTPSTVVANQRVSLVGDGFNDGSTIKEISIGGEVIESARINGGQEVGVDNGGGWSAAVNLPLSSATTSVGSREIRVTDSEGRSGITNVTILAREVTITPAVGRVGTLATVRGVNFPSKNDDGSSFSVTIEYDTGDGETTVSAVPDASGRFEVQMRIPTSADIPSTNTVKVSFEAELPGGGDGGPTIVTTVTHAVPEGVITISTDTGPPGTLVDISGQGFKAYVPVQSVSVGSIEVTPSPAPSTDVNGMMNFDILIPGLDNGIQTIEVEVSGTTASVGFTVAPSGVAIGAITLAAKATVNLGDNFVRSFNFNNDTKSWTFYSPEAPDDSTQTHFITGESYWILIGESQEVILNGKTRNLTCASGSCWNQIVW